MATDMTPSSAALQEELLRRARARAGSRPAAPAPSAVREPSPAPLSHAQRRMWLMDRLGQGGSLYSVPFATRLRGPLDVDALAVALTGLVRRHHILRTRYGQQGDEAYQEVLAAPDAMEVVVVESDGDGLPVLTEEARRPFDLSAGPLPRALVVRHGPQDHTVMLTFHHISIDGGSLETVADELSQLYAEAVDKRPHTRPDPPQYADFTRREHVAAERLGEGLDHWVRRLAGATPVRLPRPAHVPGGRAAVARTTALDAHVLPALREIGRQHRATLFTVALAASFAALHRLTGEDDLVIGCAGTHREGAAMRNLVGLCVNTLPIRVSLSGDPDFGTLVARVRDALLEAQQHRDVPFDLILERLGAGARGADGTALVRVSADVLREPTALRLPGTVAEPVDIGLGEAKFDLSFGLVDSDSPACIVQFGQSALDPAAGERLADDFRALLSAVAAEPGLTLTRLGGGPRTIVADDCHPAEAHLRADARIADAAVPLPAAGPLIAYAVLRETGGPSPAQLRSHLRAALPRESVPAVVTLLDAMPRTADGSLDTARLPGAAAAPVPQGPRAHAVTAAFAELLGRVPAPDDDFFVLGGHSLVAVQLAERLRTGLRLPVTGLDVMQCRTPRALAALLDERESERAAVVATAAPAAGRRRVREGTVLVTGGTGGVGAFVLRELAARGRPVLALARPESAHLVAGEGVEVVEGDLTDLEGLRAAVESADAVIHAACTFTRPEVDVAAMEAMVEAWSRGPFVFVSSVDAYGQPADRQVAEDAASQQPLSAYGQAKVDCEQLLLRAAGTEGRGGASVVRSPIVWGPHDRLRDQLRWGATGMLYQAALAGDPIQVPGPGAGGHDWYGAPWVHASALARAVTECLDTPVHGTANAVSGHVGWADLAAELSRRLGGDSEISLVDRVHPDLDHRWHYRSDRLAASLAERPGEDWQSVLAAMIEGPGRERA
ncbi:condensation domain-containing protein [Streptomyces sp. NPDC096193]|uniref:condensation domain-containing protein n=1 Tax=Streptomyces sp. NPDC096193 TaxID=3155821 RepID=UPI00331C383B